MAQQAPGPVMIRQIADNVYPWFAMHAGIQLGLFTLLANGPMRGDEMARALGVDARQLQPLLDNLLLAGLLTIADGRYANADEAGRFLVRGTPAYMGAQFELWDEFWRAIGQTAATIRAGAPQAEHDYSHMNENELFAWMRPLNEIAIAFGHALLARHDFTTYRSLLDVGGGLGGLSVVLTRAYPALHATVVDLPTVTPLAERYLAEEGMRDRVDILAVDVVHDAPTGQYDAAVLMRLLRCLSADHARTVLRNVGAALRPGGTIIVVGTVLDDSRLTPTNAVRVNLVFLNMYDGGEAFTETEHHAWLAQAGFTDIRREEALGITGLITARKV